MKSWRLLAAAVAVVAIAWFGLDWLRASSSAPRRARTPADAPPSTWARPQPRAAPPRAPSVPAQDPPDPGEPAAADPAKPEPTDQEIAQALDHAMRAEAVDPAWGRAMDTRVGDYFHSERATGSTLVRSECRSTLCKLEVQHASAESSDHFVNDVSSFIPPRSNAVMQPKHDGATFQTVVWFTRQGPAPTP